MGRRFDLLVFDWDGTLMDSTAAIVHAIRSAATDLGVAVPSVDQARYVIGMGLAEALQHAVPGLGAHQYPQMVERYRYHYLARDHELVLFDGVPELLQELREAGFQLAVATGKSRAGLNRALSVGGLAKFFDATRTADETFSKPNPTMLLELMDELAVPAERTLMIGDTTHDLLLASNAGAAALGVSFGAHDVEALLAHDALGVFHTVQELRQWLHANA